MPQDTEHVAYWVAYISLAGSKEAQISSDQELLSGDSRLIPKFSLQFPVDPWQVHKIHCSWSLY